MRTVSLGFLSLLGAVLLTGCAVQEPASPDAAESFSAPLVGGDRDEYGCIPSAGYQWCAVKQKCLRIWEEEC